jgi:hypothetical protein
LKARMLSSRSRNWTAGGAESLRTGTVSVAGCCGEDPWGFKAFGEFKKGGSKTCLSQQIVSKSVY